MNNSDQNYFVTKNWLFIFLLAKTSVLLADQFSALDQKQGFDLIDFTPTMASIEASHPSILQQNDPSLFALNREVSKTPINHVKTNTAMTFADISENSGLPSLELKSLSPLELQALETDIQKKQDPNFLYSDLSLFSLQNSENTQDPVAAQAAIDAQAAPPITEEEMLNSQNNIGDGVNMDTIIGSVSGVGGFFAMAFGGGFINSLFTAGSLPQTSSYSSKPIKASDHGAKLHNSDPFALEDNYYDPAKAFADQLKPQQNVGAAEAYPMHQLRPASSSEDLTPKIRRSR